MDYVVHNHACSACSYINYVHIYIFRFTHYSSENLTRRFSSFDVVFFNLLQFNATLCAKIVMAVVVMESVCKGFVSVTQDTLVHVVR